MFDDRSSATVHQDTALYTAFFDRSDSAGVATDSRVLFKGNFSWKFDESNLLYGTVSQGYRRGGSNGTPTTGYFAESPAWLTYKPDTNINYELGVKGAVRLLTYNIDAFYVDWKDPQFNTATTFWGFFAVQNARARRRRVSKRKWTAIGVTISTTGSATPTPTRPWARMFSRPTDSI